MPFRSWHLSLRRSTGTTRVVTPGSVGVAADGERGGVHEGLGGAGEQSSSGALKKAPWPGIAEQVEEGEHCLRGHVGS